MHARQQQLLQGRTVPPRTLEQQLAANDAAAAQAAAESAAASAPATPAVENAPVTTPETAPAANGAPIDPKLAAAGWDTRVGAGLGVWVDVVEQRLYLVQNHAVIWSAPCATATNGVGAEAGTQKTPLGWHTVAEKFGDGAPWGQVFRSRKATHEVWKKSGNHTEDLVLTRVLWLDGLEPGVNNGKNAAGKSVDSKARCIYIHGTNAEERIGTPSSHGCVRLTNDDVLIAYDKIPLNTPVLITD